MMSRRTPPMPVANADQFLSALRISRLLPPAAVDDLEAEASFLGADPGQLAHDLVEQGVLTAYQAEELLAGRPEGLVLGQYRILGRLGAGGMGQVYRAEHVLMKRVVALKVLAAPGRARSAGSSTALPALTPGRATPLPADRLRGEIEAAARLCHPHVIAAYDAAEADGVLFLVMEYVDGIDLGRLVAERGPLPVAEACEYVRQAALGLQYAHEKGLVHRDVKPSNLLLARPGRDPETAVVKLLDLGLARAAGTPQDEGRGGLAGTPDYMAPELAVDSRTADVRSDLYSLGCTFFYLLTGQPPYPGGGWTEKLVRHRFDPVPSVLAPRPDVPEEIAGVVQRLLAKSPAERFQTPAELAAALGRWLSARPHEAKDAAMAPRTSAAEPPPPPPPPYPGAPPRWGRVPLAVACVLAVAAGTLLAAIGSRPTPPRPEPPDRPVAEAIPEPSAPPPGRPFALGTGAAFPDLPGALAAAGDGDTVTIHGNGPFPVGPLRIAGKSLTLRAGPGFRPHLQFQRPAERPWEPLLTADRPLAVEGVDLSCESAAGTTHLVYCEKASLALKDCRLAAPNGAAAVVCRACRRVELRGCRLSTGSPAVWVELGEGETAVEVSGSTLRVSRPDGAALSVRAPDGRTAGAVRLRLEGSTFQAGRVASFSGAPGRIDLAAHGNTFTFGQALLSFAGFPTADGWRLVTSWDGRDNRYREGSGWLMVNGVPAGPRGLAAWRALWGCEEAGSRVELPSLAGGPAER